MGDFLTVGVFTTSVFFSNKWYVKSRDLLFKETRGRESLTIKSEPFLTQAAVTLCTEHSSYSFCLCTMFIFVSHQTILFYNGGLGKNRSGTSPSSSPAGHMLVIGSFSAMWARWPCCWSWTHSWIRHVCLLIAWTRPESLVQCNAY